MKLIFFTLGLSFIAQADPSLNRTPKQKLMLTDTCSKLPLRMKEIQSWTKMVEDRDCSYGKVKNSSEGMCVVDATDCLPAHVQKYHGFAPNDHGPNCWNLALVMGGLLPILRETEPEEWEFYLASPLCRRLDPNEPPQMGDIGSIEAPTQYGRDPQHGFIYISEDLVYSKNGVTMSSPYELQSMEKMKEVYPLDELVGGECAYECGPQELSRFMSSEEELSFKAGVPDAKVCYLNLSLEPVVANACAKLRKHVEARKDDCQWCGKTKLFYYRCENFKTYPFKNAQLIKEIQPLESQVRVIECSFEQSLFDDVMDDELNQLVKMNLEILVGYLKTHPLPKAQSVEDQFLIKQLSLRLESLAKQMTGHEPWSDVAKLFRDAQAQIKR